MFSIIPYETWTTRSNYLIISLLVYDFDYDEKNTTVDGRNSITTNEWHDIQLIRIDYRNYFVGANVVVSVFGFVRFKLTIVCI